MLLGGVIGFYDGFFGLGMGSFLIFLFVCFFGFDFLYVLVGVKVVNVVINLVVFVYFVLNGYFLLFLVVLMVVVNVSGLMFGIWLVLCYGSIFVCKVFLVLVGVLIVKFVWDIFRFL